MTTSRPDVDRSTCSDDDAPFTEFRYCDGEEDPDRDLDADVLTLGEALHLGEEFGYTFDLGGDNWRHRCTLGRDRDRPGRDAGHPSRTGRCRTGAGG